MSFGTQRRPRLDDGGGSKQTGGSSAPHETEELQPSAQAPECPERGQPAGDQAAIPAGTEMIGTFVVAAINAPRTMTARRSSGRRKNSARYAEHCAGVVEDILV